MEVQNSEVAQIFNQMADLLDIQGANPFRIRAYRNAARTLQDVQGSISDMVRKHEDLTELPGIGKDLSEKIEEIVETGTLKDLKKVSQKVPASLTEIMKLPSLGPKKAKILYGRLKIKTLKELKTAAEKGKIQKLEGFGEKTEQRILEELKRLESRGPERVFLAVADQTVALLERYLKATPGVEKLTVAGSYRRQKETVGDLDFLVTCHDSKEVIEQFIQYESVVKILAQGPTKASVLLRSGLQVDLRAVESESYGAALLYFTGSKAHNIKLRSLAQKQGLKINEYGLFRKTKRLASRTEADIYHALKMPYIEPELREDRGEIEAALKDDLPRLLQAQDIRGDLHSHTTDTDGADSLEDMVRAAQELGYEYLAITDHTQNLKVAGGLNGRRLHRQWDEIERLNAKFKNFRILKSAEVDILENGDLDLGNEILKEMDFAVCSVHSLFQLSREKQTSRVLRAMDNPYFRVLGHPTGRLIGKREPLNLDMEKIFEAARERGRFVEINAQPERMDLTDIYIQRAKELGLKAVISTDAHSVSQLQNMHYGVGLARRGWLEKKDVLNTLPLQSFLKAMGVKL